MSEEEGVSSRMESVIPWLGGDYNPWESCDTSQTGSLVNGEYANEEIEASCHQLICDPAEGMQASYYRCVLQNRCDARLFPI